MQNALVVYICEVMIDIIKHSFISKFNGIKPIAFSEFLEDLCKQVSQSQLFSSMRTVYLLQTIIIIIYSMTLIKVTALIYMLFCRR